MARLHDCSLCRRPPLRTHLMLLYLSIPASIHCPAQWENLPWLTFLFAVRSWAPFVYLTPRRGFHPQDNCDMPISPLPLHAAAALRRRNMFPDVLIRSFFTLFV